METPPHCTVSCRRARLDPLWIALLTLGVLLVHGYHPWAEDGGLYVPGIEYTLNPSLFPHSKAFVTAPLSYSLFAPTLAALVRASHLSLATVLFAVYLFTTALTLWAALRVARSCFASGTSCLTAVALLAAWWTMPVAGTSLLLMDPYVTARSLSTPLSLFAIVAALQPWRRQAHSASSLHHHRIPPAVLCGIALVLAAVFHPLMAGYALGFVILLSLSLQGSRPWIWVAVFLTPILVAGVLQWLGTPEDPAAIAAAHSRYYWFLSQWHWYERLGLLGPVLIFAGVQYRRPSWLRQNAQALCRASLALAVLSTLIALLYAQEHLRAHPVARLQPLRCFLLLYAVMILLCGGALTPLAHALSARTKTPILRVGIRVLPVLFITSMACTMYSVQRASFPRSLHVELPGRTNSNPWVQAFLWALDHTPEDALFALDARYVNTEGEDAQGFRAIAQRSSIPDFSKDGGEAANAPRLADEWRRSAIATAGLSSLSDAERDGRLAPLHVQWMILHADAVTAHSCPYENSVVKVCQGPLSGAAGRRTPSAAPPQAQ